MIQRLDSVPRPVGRRSTLADEASIEYVSEQLGHESIAVTMRHYAADRPETNYAILAALDRRAAQTGLKADSVAEEAE